MMATAPRLAETVVHRPHVARCADRAGLLRPGARADDPRRAHCALAWPSGRPTRMCSTAPASSGRSRPSWSASAYLPARSARGAAGAAFADACRSASSRRSSMKWSASSSAAHGRIRGGEVAVLAMGKLGGREMTAASDLDLIFLYDFDERAAASDGERPLPGAAILHAPDPAATRGALGADGGGDALRGRLPASAVRQVRTARHPYRRLLRLPGQRGLDLGAHGTHPRAVDCRRQAHRVEDRLGDRQALVAQRETKKTRADVLEMRRMIAAEKGGERRLGPQAGAGRPGRYRIRRAVPATGSWQDVSGNPLAGDRDRARQCRQGRSRPAA